jgi:hypothetical protein
MSFKSWSSELDVRRDVAPEVPDETGSAHNDVWSGEMAKYGITRVRVDYFHYRDFRYTSLKDAIAQAERDQVSAETPDHFA